MIHPAEALRSELSGTVELRDGKISKVEAIARIAVNLGLKDDLKASRFITEYLEGRPKQQVDLHTLSGGIKAVSADVLEDLLNSEVPTDGNNGGRRG